MTNPISPWAAQQNYPATPATKWAGTLTKVNPVYPYFSPGQTPSAQVLNGILNARDVAINGIGSTGAELAAANFGPVSSGQIDGASHLYTTYAVCFDHAYSQWVAALNNSTPLPALYTSQDGISFVPGSTFGGAFPNAAVTPKAVGAYPTGTVVVYGDTGALGHIVRFTQGTGALPVGTANTAWASRSGSLCNQGAMAYFWGATTPAMYFVGASSFQARAAWLGFAASDTAANDGVGTAGVWTDQHLSLPASFLSGNSLIQKFEAAQSATALCFAMCGQTTGTDASFLLSIAANGTMADATPSFIGVARSIRGLAYSASDGLWGLLSVDAGGTTYLDVSADLVTWTNVLGLAAQGVGLAVVRNTWVIAFSPSFSAPDKCLYVSNVANVLQGAAAALHYSSYPPFVNSFLNTRTFTLQSNEVPSGLSAATPRSPQLLGAYLFNSNSRFTQSLRVGHVDPQQSGVAAAATQPGWNTVLDLDFTKLPTATYAADGPVTIGSLAWTKSGTANEQTVLTVTTGSGLKFAPKISSNGAKLFLPLTTIVPANVLLWSTAIRIWVWVQAQTFANPGDQLYAGLFTSTGALFYEALYGLTAGPVGFAKAVASPTPAVSQQNFAGAPGASTNVLVLETPALDSGVAKYISGTYNAGSWPTEAGALYQTATADCGTSQWQDPSTGTPISPSLAGLQLNAQASGTTAALTVTIGRVRVDYKL